MRIFKEPNLSGDWKCPICEKSDKKEVVLIGVRGTEDGNKMQAEQIHLDCIDLIWNKEYGIMFQKMENK